MSMSIVPSESSMIKRGNCFCFLLIFNLQEHLLGFSVQAKNGSLVLAWIPKTHNSVAKCKMLSIFLESSEVFIEA